MKKVLITGITGQDGAYLTQLLLKKGYEVHGIIRRSSSFNTSRINDVIDHPQVKTHYGDMTDSSNLNRLLRKIQPDEIYNLAAQSHVRVSFDMPDYTADVVGLGTLRLLDAILDTGIATRFYQASSSEMYGLVQEVPQSEKTPFYPRSPYACAKVFAYWITVNYREAYGIHASNGILFNHESPMRGETFVTRKITSGLAKILAKTRTDLALGNLDAKRDWGHAEDYVYAMWLMLQQPKADDYVIATGQTHSVRDFLDATFGLVDMDWKKYIKQDPKFLRPTEVDLLIGDASKAKKKLGWKSLYTFKDLAFMMLVEDMRKYGLEPKKFIPRVNEIQEEMAARHEMERSAMIAKLGAGS